MDLTDGEAAGQSLEGVSGSRAKNGATPNGRVNSGRAAPVYDAFKSTKGVGRLAMVKVTPSFRVIADQEWTCAGVRGVLLSLEVCLYVYSCGARLLPLA